MVRHCSKKGFFFTMAAVALSIVLIISFKVYDTGGRDQKNEVVITRVLTINDFVKDVENDVQKGLYISSKRAILGMQEYITGQGVFLPNATSAFEEGLLLGTIGGAPMNFTANATFPDWTLKIQEQAVKADTIANITILSLSLRHSDPWNINITANVLLNVTDKRNTASWQRQREVSARVGISGFEDPLYVVKTSGKVTSIMKQTNYTPFAAGGDVTNLMLHTNNSFYIASNLSPSYLMRLEGNLSPSPYGVESLVNVYALQVNGVQVQDRSVADAVYFGTGTTANYRINSTPSWFKLDEQRLELYGVAGLTI